MWVLVIMDHYYLSPALAQVYPKPAKHRMPQAHSTSIPLNHTLLHYRIYLAELSVNNRVNTCYGLIRVAEADAPTRWQERKQPDTNNDKNGNKNN